MTPEKVRKLRELHGPNTPAWHHERERFYDPDLWMTTIKGERWINEQHTPPNVPAYLASLASQRRSVR